MAEYTWRQWENEQNEANNIHADDCYRWQAGIELAGGTWDGEWVDLDKTGKGLVTIDQFNALESQIQSKVSSYTPKNYDPDSTVQIVPGVDGWNKVEDGILKAICTPDGTNRNMLTGTKEMDYPSTYTGGTVLTGDTYNGFAVRSNTNSSGTQSEGLVFSTATGRIVLDPDADYTVSFWAKGTVSFLCFLITAVSESAVTSQGVTSTAADGSIRITPTDDWERYWVKWHTLSTISAGTIGALYFGRLATADTGTIYLCGPKFEKGSATDWTPAPEDYGYPSSTALNASPQSVEESDEVAAPEAEEIE